MAGMQIPTSHADLPKQQQPTEINLATICQMGQDIIQELVQKTNEAFQNFKQVQLPIGTQPSIRNMQTVSKKIADILGQIDICFKRLRQVYRECQKKMPDDVESGLLIPYINMKVDNDDSVAVDELPLQKSGKEIILEKQKVELERILEAKNSQLKMLVEQMSHLVWEVNSILALQDDV